MTEDTTAGRQVLIVSQNQEIQPILLIFSRSGEDDLRIDGSTWKQDEITQRTKSALLPAAFSTAQVVEALRRRCIARAK
jgi:hypothetical protein